ncbi:M48 family metalloprotease [Curvibacter sp. APW13]|uniref:M48 family metalloprotease n=1 Tax=Curvibacter sp. APW13 TaxID=3077236 RepID=UPI0028DE05E7|nr:M48 family metalloprotease [Curvibacter sp. APW13]MDT8989905.1 M48 family metalloprotease [Curvibacter sp. APW13]
MRRFGYGLILGVALLAGCGSTMVNPVTGEAERSVMSEDDELAEGAKAHAEVLKEYGKVANPALQAYVTALGNKLAAQSHRSHLQWHFTVLDSPEINAFALPGGYVYVTRGILPYLESEADLAGVMGHEIGHVTARHGAQRATKQQDATLGVLAASVLGAVLESQGFGGAGRLAGDLSQTAAAGYIASYGREQELQADSLGAEYLSRVHYDPRNMVDVIRALKAQEQYAADVARAEGRPVPKGNDWLASHPSNDQRLEMISNLAAQYQNGKYEDEGRARYQKAIAGITFGDSAAQGLVRGREFYHPTLGVALTAPQGWRIQNDEAQLTVLNAAGDAGLVLRVVPPSAGRNHNEVLRNVLKPTQGRTEARSMNGLSATHFVGARQTAQGSQRLEATVVSGPGDNTYLLQYLARDTAALQRAMPGLQAVESSFRPLSAQDRSQAREWAIATAPYPKGGFAELARNSPLPRAEQQLRLLNGVYGGGEPKPGQMVKVVVAR